jgi:hypothetical protein
VSILPIIAFTALIASIVLTVLAIKGKINFIGLQQSGYMFSV